MHEIPNEPFAWDDVRLFLALARSRTVGGAAKLLRVDASTVSRRLATLEAAVGATLFDRGRNGLAATEAVERLMPVAEEIEEAMLRFGGAAAGLDGVAQGLVKITCPPDVAEVAVVPRLRALRDRHPKLQIQLVPSEATLDLTRREADIALRAVRPESGDLVVSKLGSIRWIVAASPKLARSLGTVREWGALPWIGWGDIQGAPPARWLHGRGVDPIVRTDSLLLQLGAIAAGVGVGLVPEPSLAHYRLARVTHAPALRPDVAGWPASDLFLATHRALRNVPRVRVVWDHLSETIRALLAAPPRSAARATSRATSRGV